MRLQPHAWNRTTRRAALRRAGQPLHLGRPLKSLALAAALTGFTPALAAADEPTQRPPRQSVEEIEVVGDPDTGYKADSASMSRYGGALRDIPQQITVVPQQLLEDQGATTLQDALRNVTGIGISAGEGGAQGDSFTLRGYDAANDIYIDGVRDQGSYFRDSFNLESVEVTKGASATYFGRGSTGGAINQVTKSPKLDASYSGILTAGSGPFLRGTGDVNVPFGDSSAVRVNFMVQDAEIVDRDEVESNRRGFAPSLAFGIGTSTQLTLSYLYLEEDNIPDYGLPYIDERPARVDRDTFFGLEDEDFEETQVNVATLRLDHSFSDTLRLSNTTRYSHVNREAAPTAPRPCSTDPDLCGGLENGIRRNRPERDGQDTILSNQTDVIAELELAGLMHTLATGFELARETSKLKRYDAPGPVSIGLDPDAISPGFTPDSRSLRSNTFAEATSYGVYVTDRIRLNDYVDLVGGLRWDVFSTRFNDEKPTGPDTTGPDFDRKDRMLSYRGGLLFHPTDDQTYYLSYATSFNPSAQALQLRERDAGTDPEKNRTIELGAKLDLRDGALSLQGAVFQIDKTDARETVEDIQVLSGAQRVRGFEVGIAGLLFERWNVFAGYTFLDTELRSGASSTADQDGNELSRTPRHTATFWNSYAFPGERLRIGGGPTYVSHRYSSTANTNKVDGYVRWDATLSYQLSENIDLRLNVQNLADEEYFDETSGGHAIPAPGRTILLSTSYSSR